MAREALGRMRAWEGSILRLGIGREIFGQMPWATVHVENSRGHTNKHTLLPNIQINP